MRITFLFLVILIAGCTPRQPSKRVLTDLSGEWEFAADTSDIGIKERWYDSSFPDHVRLPGSMAENGKGFDVTLSTGWTGDIVDKSWFTDEKYAKYREPGNIKVPFWLQPEKYYKGVAWYSRKIDIKETHEGTRYFLRLERPHWETSVFINGDSISTANSLAVPHMFDITSSLKVGENRISVRVDNRVVVPVGVNSHSISDHTQSNWNGITGRIELEERPDVWISSVNITPDPANRKIRVEVKLNNSSGKNFRGKLNLAVTPSEGNKGPGKGSAVIKVETAAERSSYYADVILGEKAVLWSEFNPALYDLHVTLTGKGGVRSDGVEEQFGLRNFTAKGTGFELNGNPVFLRGTLECCIFPLTGYPPSDIGSWIKVLETFRSYGLNTVRFHSWCPPEAAFEAADRLGFYFQIECSSWANQGTAIGDGKEIDRFIYTESDRIIEEYGNHPSFCMLAYGNEPAGRNQEIYLGELIKYWKATDNRRVYTSAAGWPVIPENDFNLIPAPRLQQWGEGLNSIINRDQPNTLFDFRKIIGEYSIPVVSHEIGQWCVYPDFSEIEKYKGVLKARNFEIFRESLNEKGMGDLSGKFLKASGKLQALCYKAEVEAALRTPGFGGFHLLQLHDFPGQGTALVGVLNPFYENKGYITPSEFRMFCNTTVPLARMSKHVFTSSETFRADVEIAHWGEAPMKRVNLLMLLKDSYGNILAGDSLQLDEIPVGNCFSAGSFSFPLSSLKAPAKYRFETVIKGTEYMNGWDIWVYPPVSKPEPGSVTVTSALDYNTVKILENGGSVLWLPYGKIGKGNGAEVAIGFSSIFWNTAWTNNQAPHTLGILCDPDHPAFSAFPTEYHSNWQWWDPVTHSQAMILDNLPSDIKPVIQPVDTWFENRKLALAFEVACGKGKLMVCSIDLLNEDQSRIASKQLLKSLLLYMNSPAFKPVSSVELSQVRKLTENR